ncbi:MAG: hypothetical protein RIA69_06710 [Cyclobacteriaceae bacterium]|uniref:hypothetical protein n=1 Tax=Fulvivirga sp. TaxID=1931237 RepID=UPI0032EFFEF2
MNRILIVSCMLALSVKAHSQVFENIRLEDNLFQVKSQVIDISDSTKLIRVDPPVFPLAKNDEQHLIAYNVKLKSGVIEKVVFTFSDNKLTFIECRGNVLNALTKNRANKSQSYLNYQVFINDLLFVDYNQDAAWFLTQESVHPNLFTWNNPLLENQELSYEPSAKLPKFITMEDDLEILESLFKKESRILQKDTLDGSDHNAQIQLNAFGIEYAGFPRKFEARFGDGKLNTLWILTAKGEEDRIRQKLITEYGHPIFLNEKWEFFSDWTVALRKDTPEVLFLSTSQALNYKNSLSK